MEQMEQTSANGRHGRAATCLLRGVAMVFVIASCRCVSCFRCCFDGLKRRGVTIALKGLSSAVLGKGTRLAPDRLLRTSS
jgi:hypothetical protein